MKAWLKRFGLHLAAAIGATSVFVAAAAVGAHQTREQTGALVSFVSPTAAARRKPTPTVVVLPAPLAAAPTGASSAPASPTSVAPSTARPGPAAVPTPEKVVPERSLAGTIVNVLPDGVEVLGVGGREWRVSPAPGALIRLNGKPARIDALRAGDTVVILGQAQAQPPDGPMYRFLAHAITARAK
ncbi:MAG: hypothetical protein M3069_02560 [Chloroflexota bacterium]|nr:hypothetical protein [Chloroflexota bacterium]